MPVGPTLKTVRNPGRSLTTSIRTRSPVRSRTWSGDGGTFFMSRVRRPGGWLRVGRGDGHEAVRADLAADDQPQVDRGRLRRLGYGRRVRQEASPGPRGKARSRGPAAAGRGSS